MIYSFGKSILVNPILETLKGVLFILQNDKVQVKAHFASYKQDVWLVCGAIYPLMLILKRL